MGFRIADTEDLPRLKEVCRDIVKDMDSRGICIWDEIYPCEFLQEDILKGRLYLLEENGVLLSAFALCGEHDGETKVGWKDSSAKAIYLDRLGVHPGCGRRGIGSRMLKEAKDLTKQAGARYLRLFVVDSNEPAISLYQKNGFETADGIYEEVIDDDLVLREYGMEAEIV